jgi:cellulose synthase/poly-beta-1,6-N-acetylglucosamine synthase-like glycosyltransferase
MLFSLITAISLFFSLAYFLLMIRYSLDWNRLEEFHSTRNSYKVKVSVIVIARNEAANIAACLKSIAAQTYPKELVEILLADDQSGDSTVEIASNLGIEQLKILTNKSLTGKKQLLSYAISVSEAELIICTDADCQVPQGWINQLIGLYVEHDAKFIAAPVQFSYNKTLFQKFQALDFLGMMAITGAGIKGAYLYMCNGANLAYPKAVFQEVGGFEGIDKKASGDDMLLLQKLALKYPNDIVYIKNPRAAVLTKAQKTLNEFWQQRLRWASKSGDYPQTFAIIQLLMVWLFMFCILICFIVALFEPSLFVVFAIMLLTKIIADFLLLYSAASYFSSKHLLRIFIPALFLHWFYILSVGFVSVFKKKYRWKGRSWS